MFPLLVYSKFFQTIVVWCESWKVIFDCVLTTTISHKAQHLYQTLRPICEKLNLLTHSVKVGMLTYFIELAERLKTWFCHDDCEFWCIVRACSWICQQVDVGGGGLAVYIHGQAVFLNCILPLYFLAVCCHCISQLYFPTVFLYCILSLYFSAVIVFVNCISQLYFVTVYLNCIFLLNFSTVCCHCISQLIFTNAFLNWILPLYFWTVFCYFISGMYFSRVAVYIQGGARCTWGIQQNTKFGAFVQFWVANITLEN